ncbi:hypothetical protein PVAND_000784 [Polypedilum vanderplanki]|uniref:Uncharacterized protein n=1 Tax=Polypedilum vanderplanki TaxID=319348 RepID=A0A9J6BMA9_POLVA|nr:hypothetical protein PVAND_000784 [Polypedilum vanderplanki]
MRLILFLIIALCFVSSINTECFQVYICCRKTENDCLEYCGPYIECDDNELGTTTEEAINENNLQTTTDSESNFDTTTNSYGGIVDGAGFNVLNGGMCRMGFKLVKGKCRRVMK